VPKTKKFSVTGVASGRTV